MTCRPACLMSSGSTSSSHWDFFRALSFEIQCQKAKLKVEAYTTAPATNIGRLTVQTFTTREIAKTLAVPDWKIRRLFEDGNLPEPERFGGLRVIRSVDIPAIVDALRRRGWISKDAAVSS